MSGRPWETTCVWTIAAFILADGGLHLWYPMNMVASTMSLLASHQPPKKYNCAHNSWIIFHCPLICISVGNEITTCKKSQVTIHFIWRSVPWWLAKFYKVSEENSFNSLWLIVDLWRYRTGSTLVQIMASGADPGFQVRGSGVAMASPGLRSVHFINIFQIIIVYIFRIRYISNTIFLLQYCISSVPLTILW